MVRSARACRGFCAHARGVVFQVSRRGRAAEAFSYPVAHEESKQLSRYLPVSSLPGSPIRRTSVIMTDETLRVSPPPRSAEGSETRAAPLFSPEQLVFIDHMIATRQTASGPPPPAAGSGAARDAASSSPPVIPGE